MKNIEILYHKDPFEYFLIPNFFNQEELKGVRTELEYIKSTEAFTDKQEALGTSEKEGIGYIAKRQGVFLHNFFNSNNFRSISHIYKGLKKIYEKSLMDEVCKQSTYTKLLRLTNYDSVLISNYKHGDVYSSHCDLSIFTVLVYVWDKKTFIGGDLVFKDYDFKIEPHNNLAVIFPGLENHEVTEIISTDGDMQGYKRTCISMFINIHPEKK
jgi:hypothetical protein